jgi:hypothetical protein
MANSTYTACTGHREVGNLCSPSDSSTDYLMDTLELNKIAGGILATLLVLYVINSIGNVA